MALRALHQFASDSSWTLHIVPSFHSPPTMPALPCTCCPFCWLCFPQVGLPDSANDLQCLEHAYTKKSFSVYLKFQFTLASCVSNCFLTFFRSLLKCHLLGEAFSGLPVSISNSPVLSQCFYYTSRIYFLLGIHHHLSEFIFCMVLYFLSPSLYVSSMRAGIFIFISICFPSA